MDFDDPIERRKWLARLVESVNSHARKAGRPFELTEFIETLRSAEKVLRRHRASISTSGAFLMRSSSIPSRRASIAVIGRRV